VRDPTPIARDKLACVAHAGLGHGFHEAVEGIVLIDPDGDIMGVVVSEELTRE
jgi:hypothetical protein